MRNFLNLCATAPLFLATNFAPSHYRHCGTAPHFSSPIPYSDLASVELFAFLPQLNSRLVLNPTLTLPLQSCITWPQTKTICLTWPPSKTNCLTWPQTKTNNITNIQLFRFFIPIKINMYILYVLFFRLSWHRFGSCIVIILPLHLSAENI